MYRSEKLVIRLTVAERGQIMRLAEAERIPPSTLARSILLKQAERTDRPDVQLKEGVKEHAK